MATTTVTARWGAESTHSFLSIRDRGSQLSVGSVGWVLSPRPAGS